MTVVVAADKMSGMDAVAGRIRWVLDELGWSAREWSEKAELAPSHIASIMERGGDRTAGTTLVKMAKSAGVSVRWLLTGEGLPFEKEAQTFGDLPNWPSLLADAKTLASYRPWVWETVEKFPCLPAAPVTAGMIAGLARVAAEHIHSPVDLSRSPKPSEPSTGPDVPVKRRSC